VVRPARFLILGWALALFAAETRPVKQFTAMQKKWWSLQPVVKPALPAATGSPIDAFLDAARQAKGVTANPPAPKVTLLRRVTLDLTGLPPTPEEVQAFVSDASPQAFERVVDRLLASPHYGERWARHWLDLARYADSEGFKSDETRPNIWRYRDYVIRSFNQDKPYSRFVAEQIAGDELYPDDPEARIATGFNRNFPDESNQANIALRRQELLNDITDTVGYTLLGLTVACARCHDHKFDPILHRDYYRLQAFFANTRIDDEAPAQVESRHRAALAQLAHWEEQTRELRAEMQAVLKPAREAFYQERLSRFPEEIQQALTMDPAQRTPYQWQMAIKARTQVTFTDEEIAGKLKGQAKVRYQQLLARLKTYPPKPEVPVAQTMSDFGVHAPPTHVLSQGAYDAPLEEVQPGFLTILDPSDARITPRVDSTGRRAALAEWLTDPKNPLTARVMVNRVWHHHFGKGLVATPSDFGVMGDRPANKELLDYLAATFIEDGWSLKKLHKRILLTKAYQQSSGYQEAAAKIDPDNKLVWRYNRRRLEGEAIRDSMLAVSGVLHPKMYGPGVFPPLPAGLEMRGGWKKHEDAVDASRRSIYIFVRRNVRYPMIEAFDMPDTHESCARRNQTTSPMQALELINNPVVLDWAEDFARRVENDRGLSSETRIDRAWRLAFSRPASNEEQSMAQAFLAKQQAAGSRSPLADLCHAILSSNEFLYID
jgi:hypothetical protein